jgi:hypothetical protein
LRQQSQLFEQHEHPAAFEQPYKLRTEAPDARSCADHVLHTTQDVAQNRSFHQWQAEPQPAAMSAGGANMVSQLHAPSTNELAASHGAAHGWAPRVYPPAPASHFPPQISTHLPAPALQLESAQRGTWQKAEAPFVSTLFTSFKGL